MLVGTRMELEEGGDGDGEKSGGTDTEIADQFRVWTVTCSRQRTG